MWAKFGGKKILAIFVKRSGGKKFVAKFRGKKILAKFVKKSGGKKI